MRDVVRRRYLAKLREITGRNVIIYYSGWLQKPGSPGTEINDDDKNGFMTVIHELDRRPGLDLVLRAPGGDTAATESLVDCLRSIFGNDIRAIVPQLAMSGGAMIACSCKEILMGKQSSLAPIAPQFITPQLGGAPAHGVVEEFNRAKKEISKDPSTIPIWQPIIAKYSPAFIGECEKAIAWSNEMTKEWLRGGMFQGDCDSEETIKHILQELGDHALTRSHARHISMERCKKMGLKVVELESDDELQDAVLSLHHACMLTFSETQALKIIENHNGASFIKVAMQALLQVPLMAQRQMPPAP